MTNIVTLNSAWGVDANGNNCPQVVNDYPPVNANGTWTGISQFSQIGSCVPNDTWFGQIWCDDATLTALQADSKYNGNLTVVYNDQDPPLD